MGCCCRQKMNLLCHCTSCKIIRFFNNIFYSIFSIDSIVETDAYSCRVPVKVGKVKMWRKVGEMNVSVHFYFPPVSVMGRGERVARP